MNLALYIGNQALAQGDAPAFHAKWNALHACCPWATGYQHPDFVMPWYQLYQAAFLPVMVVMENEDHSLAGLLTLAFDKKTRRLVGAGERQAEYHGWLAKPDAGNGFIRHAMQKVRDHFPDADLCLKYLPPGIPLRWIADDGGQARSLSLRSHARPTMAIEEAAMDRQRRSKNNRQNLNRLKKLGDVQFRKIVEHGQFIRVFDDMCAQYDFRQGALYGYMPFSSDPSKKPFYTELHRRGLLHVTVLTVDGRIVASHCGLVTKGAVLHLGINTHDPAYAAHSPGLLLLALVGVQLVSDGIPLFDLTPGGDGYKERFATDHDVVYELTAYSNAFARLRRETILSAKWMLKKRLSMAGVSTAHARSALEKISGFRNLDVQRWLKTLHKDATPPPLLYRYCAAPPPHSNNPLSISKNCFRDLFRFDASDASVSRWQLLSTAMERMERLNHLYSLRKGEKLLMYCWAGAHPGRTGQGLPDGDPKSTAFVLFDLYVDRNLPEQELVRCFIEQIVLELKDYQRSAEVYFRGALSKDLQKVIRQCGFACEVE